MWTHVISGSSGLFCPASAAAAQHAYAGVIIAVTSALTGTTVACFLGSRKNISFEACSLISVRATNNSMPLQIQVAVGRTDL